jgi:DNA processing protein
MEYKDLEHVHDQWAYVLCVATQSIGWKTIKKIRFFLYKFHIGWNDFLEGKEILWEKCGLNALQKKELRLSLDTYSPEGYAQKLNSQKTTVLLPNMEIYPELLHQIEDAPPCLFVLGEQSAVGRLKSARAVIGVVGTRKMTEYGKFVTTKITTELCQLDAAIVSGFMYGVDLTAHQTALQQGGQTIGVLGYGFDYLPHLSYLPQKWLQEFFEKSGVLLSEYPPDTAPRKGTFLQRNRIIAGMSHATIVTEAAHKSGSLHTATCAIEYNRTVCSVPGSIRSPFSQGTQDLINKGAVFVRSGYDVLKELGGSIDFKEKNTEAEHQLRLPLLSDVGKHICQLIAQDHLSTDQLCQRLHLLPQEVNVELTELELLGHIQKVGSIWNLQ